jgi:uncharacterized protein YacL
MACSISCIIATVFLIGMIYFYNITNNSNVISKYKAQLPVDLQKIYEKISKERMHISLYGYGLGLILSLLIIFYNLKLKKNKLNTIPLVCIVMATCFLTNYFYYILSPKSDWMLNHIKSEEQIKAWLIMYREMQVNYHIGLVLGIVAVGIFAFAFRC